MLKNRLFNIIKNREDKLYFKLTGNLKVFGFDKNKRLVHIDDGQNTVTTWAKQMFMKNFGGVPYLADNTTDIANQNYINRTSFEDSVHRPISVTEGLNTDGALLSNSSYFTDITQTNLKGNKGADWDGAYVPHFPTKMLFGTGIEIHDNAGYKIHFSEIASDIPYTTGMNADFLGYESDAAGLLLDISETNLYSNIIDETNNNKPKKKVRTVDSNSNSILANIKQTFSPTSTSLAGAIKNNFYTNSDTITMFETGLGPTNSGYKINTTNRGIGAPAFIYIDRASIDNGEASNIYINKTTGVISNRITFQITMPAQLGPNYYYPYNGYYLREAGLFTDARFYHDTSLASNTVPAAAGDELNAYNALLFGSLLAKRRIATVYKAFDNSYTFSWTLYIE